MRSSLAEYEEVKQLQRSNGRREERLKRVRTKNFQKKEEEVEVYRSALFA